jgi:hypothetical protein
LISKSAKKISVDPWLPWAQNGDGFVCWGHTNRPDPSNFREAEIRYWGTSMGQGYFNQYRNDPYGRYNYGKKDATKEIMGDRFITFKGDEVEAVLISDRKDIIAKFPEKMLRKGAKQNVIVVPVTQNSKKQWVAKVAGKSVNVGRLEA